jgi:hypothetical protein
MPTSNRVESPRVCPRCKVVLPPGESICYSCGFQLAQKKPDSTPQPVQSSLSSGAGKDRSRIQSKGVFIYFISVCLVVVLFAFLLLRAAGFSLSTFIPFLAAAHSTVPYPVPKENPLFSDSFFNDEYGWNLQSSPGNYAVALGHGTLTLEIEQPKLLWELIPGERSYSDFTLTVNAMLSRGDQNDGYGVYIRGTANQASDLATYYRFELYGNGSYAIFKGTLDPGGHSTSTTIADYTLSSVIQPHGKLNHLMVIARGATLSFIVNGQLLKTISDHSFASGSVALFVSNLSQAKPGAQVQFSQFAIYPIQA